MASGNGWGRHVKASNLGCQAFIYFTFGMQRVEKCRNRVSKDRQEKYQFCVRNKLLIGVCKDLLINQIIQNLFKANAP